MSDPQHLSVSSASAPAPPATVQVTERDVVFSCPHCGGELIVDMDGAGMHLPCTLCGHEVIVPAYQGASFQFLEAATAQLADQLQDAPHNSRRPDDRNLSPGELRKSKLAAEQRLREAQNQASDLRGLANHARIQLHRYELKLEMLQRQQSALRSEISALEAALAARVASAPSTPPANEPASR